MNGLFLLATILVLSSSSGSVYRISAGESGRFRRDARVLQPPCPAEWDIRPCNCTGRPGVPNIDCSDVADAVALKKVFSFADHHHFRAFEVRESNLSELQSDQFGIHSAVLFFLNDNKISKIDKDAFKGSENSIELLRLDGNELTSIPVEALSTLKTLQVLVLSRNQIGEVPKDAFPVLQSVEVVDLDGNLLSSIGENAFSKLSGLMKLSLANNQLREIGAKAFVIDQSRFPIQINLGNNSISKLDSSAFEDLKIQYLNLDYNKMEVLPQALFERLLLTNMNLSIKDNPIDCNNTDNKWLLESTLLSRVQGIHC